MEICINYEERLARLKKEHSHDQSTAMSCLHNMSVAEFRKAFVKYVSHTTVEIAGRKVLKLPCGKNDIMEGKVIIDQAAPTVYASIIREDETRLYLSIADESRVSSIEGMYDLAVNIDKNDKVRDFIFTVELYYVKS